MGMGGCGMESVESEGRDFGGGVWQEGRTWSKFWIEFGVVGVEVEGVGVC